MDEDFDLEALIESSKKLSETFNDLSTAFIRFSLAHNDLRNRVKSLQENNPTLFSH